MTRPEHIGSTFEKKARSIIDFLTDLKTKLPSPRLNSSDLILADVGHYITTAKALAQKPPLRPSSNLARSLEKIGRELWNLCIHLNREPDRNVDLDCRVRLLALHVIELGRSSRRTKPKDEDREVVYLLGLSMTVGRICLQGGDLDTCRSALQRAAELVDRLKALSEKDRSEQRPLQVIRLEADYLTMRMALKETRLEVADHMFSKTESLQQQLDISSAENMADTLRNIGSDLSRKDFTMSVKWLRRAFGIINCQPLENLSVEGLDCRLAICQDLIQSLLGVGSDASVSEATDLVAYLEGEVGNNPIILHWKLEILQKCPGESANADTCASILRRMIRVFDSTNQTFQFLLYHIQELRTKNPRVANNLLDELLKQQVLPSSNRDWLDKLVVRKVWLSTMDDASTESQLVCGLSELLTTILDSIDQPLSPEVAGASQSLIWKKVKSTTTENQLEVSDKWCSVALHEIFASGGDANKARFSRKRILIALALNTPDEAHLIYNIMSTSAQDNVLTKYLMFKVALRTWDTGLGIECIQHLAEAAERTCGRSQDMLYACIREAQQAGDRLCTVAALKAVAENWDPVRSETSCLTSVLRCGIRLVTMMDNEVEQAGEVRSHQTFTEDTCKLFETAASRAQKTAKDQEDNKIFTVPELNWFRKNAYNIGVTKCTSTSWQLHDVIRVFATCLVFIGCYPLDVPKKDQQDMALMAMRCHFVIAAALVSIARTEDRTDEYLQRYLEMRQHITSFDASMESSSEQQPEEVVRDLHQKLATLSVFNFEAAVALKAYDDLPEIVRKAEICSDESAFKAMGDCLLRSETPGRVLFTTLRLIINQIHTLSPFNSTHLCKYIRCLFQAILPLESSLALQLIDQAIKIAHDGYEVGAPLPGVEMEWLVSKTFNHAIDFYARGQEAECGRWAGKGIELAGWMDDGGALRGLLEEKFAKLRFEERR